MDASDWLLLVFLVILIALSAFFSSAETAMMSVNKIRIRTLSEEGDKRALMVMALTEKPEKMLSAILIGNNVVNLSASALSTVFAGNIAAGSGIPLRASTLIGIATGILTLAVLIFGEITPKNAAASDAERMALFYAPIITVLTKVLTPVIFIVNAIAGLIMKLLRIKGSDGSKLITEDEFLTVLDVSHEEGVIESEEKEMINNVVDFGDSVASDVMVPRIDVTFLDIGSSYDDVLEIFREDKYSRIPVYEGDKDHIAGILNLKDFFFYSGDKEEFRVRNILRKPFFIYEFQKTSDIMVEMQRMAVGMAIVLDEYGAVAGIVTMEDLLEEIVGEIRDEYDIEETDDIIHISDTEYVVSGSCRLDDIDEFFDLSLESDDYDSIAGHILNRLGHIPEEGEYVSEDGILFIVKEMDKNRIAKVYVKLPDTSKDV